MIPVDLGNLWTLKPGGGYMLASRVTPIPPAGLTDAQAKEVALEIVSTAENSTLDWAKAYAYIEDIGDGRGYTGGIVGWCSGTGDMLALVKYAVQLQPGNSLAKWVTPLTQVMAAPYAERPTKSAQLLGTAFISDWKAAAGTSWFQQAQRDERDRVYWSPAYTQAKKDGVGLLGLVILYDISVNHGPGTDSQSFGGIVATATARAKPPALGGSESAYLAALIDTRETVLKGWGDWQSNGRQVAHRQLLANNPGMAFPITWPMYGTWFTLPSAPTSPTPPTPPAPVTQVRFAPFTASNGAASTYHTWAGRNVGDPVLIWLHGDAAFEHKNPDSTHVFAGSTGVVKVCVDRGITVVSALTPDTTGTQTWWENPTRNVTYLADLATKLKEELKPSRIYLGGYSGGAQFITQYFIPQKSALLVSGGSMVYGGGGKPITPSSPTFDAVFKQSWWMNFTTGANDTAANSGESYDALAYAKAGVAWYTSAGFEVDTNWPAGIDHDISERFGGWVAASLDKHDGR